MVREIENNNWCTRTNRDKHKFQKIYIIYMYVYSKESISYFSSHPFGNYRHKYLCFVFRRMDSTTPDRFPYFSM